MIIDTHTHVTETQFDADREEVMQRAKEAGVTKIFEVACETKIWDKALKFSERNDVYISFGVHPHEASKASKNDLEKLEMLLQNKKTIALGEIGLDYHYDLSPRNIQRELFLKQLDIADNYNKPVIVHCRSAYEEMITMFKNYKKIPRGVIHSYAGTVEEAKTFLDMGFYIGIPGTVTFPKSDKVKEVVLETPIEKLLIETDCPYRAPQKFRGKRNEPAYVVEVLKEVAVIKNISFEEAAKITTANALKLFNIGE